MRPYFNDYSANKVAINMFTRYLALELAPFGINVNVIGPAFTATEMTAARLRDPELYKQTVSDIPLGRDGRTKGSGILRRLFGLVGIRYYHRADNLLGWRIDC